MSGCAGIALELSLSVDVERIARPAAVRVGQGGIGDQRGRSRRYPASFFSLLGALALECWFGSKSGADQADGGDRAMHEQSAVPSPFEQSKPPEGKETCRKRLAYAPPRLVKYGSVATLTQGIHSRPHALGTRKLVPLT